MAKNTGRPTQKEFEARIARYGKRAHLKRFTDASEVRGKTGAAGFYEAQPSDYFLTFDGTMRYLEVKSSQDATAWRFSQMEKSQVSHAEMITSAGGRYDIVVQRLPDGTWFHFPYSLVKTVREQGRSSIPWSMLPTLKDF